uniref:Pentatricopeptide repeat-containing protein n=1 Tax=Aegilops tauschii TaxID=37682 RepID=M8ASM3_AEGTA
MTSVILDLIATKTKTPKNMTKCDGVGMTQVSVPEIDASGESNRKCGTVADNDAVVGGDRSEGGKVTRMSKHESTYSGLISLSARHRRMEQAVGLYEEMRAHGIVPSNDTCASLLALYDKSEDYSKALSRFSEMERSRVVIDGVIYGILIRIYGKIWLYDDAQRTFEEIDNMCFLSVEQTYVAMAQVHMNAGNYGKALQVFGLMRSRNVKPLPFSYGALLRCHVAREDIAAAEDAFRALCKYGLPDVFCCNDLLRLYVKLGQLEKASAFIRKMRKEDILLDEALCMTVMKVSCKSGMIADVDKILKEMENEGVTMKNSTIVSMIEMYARSRTSVMQEQDSSSKALGCQTDHSTLDTTFRSLLHTPLGSSIACQLIRKLSREGSTCEAKFLHEQLTELVVEPEDSATATLMVQYGQEQKLQQAVELFESASTLFPVGGPVYNAMVDALCKCGKIEEAYHLIMKMADQGQSKDVVTISILVNHLTKHVNLVRRFAAVYTHIAKLLPAKFQEAENIIHAASMVKLSLIPSCTILLSSRCSSQVWINIFSNCVYGLGGKLDKAAEMFTSAQELGLPIEEKIYTNMLNFYGKAGRHQDASLLFNRMKELGIMPGKTSFNSMINAYATSRLHDKAEIVFQEMKSQGHTEKVDATPKLSHLIFAFLKEGQIDEAQRICCQMQEIGVAVDLACCRAMMRAYLEHGRVDEGISLFETIRRSLKPNGFILSATFQLYVHSGREPEAGDVLEAIGLHGASFLRSLKGSSKFNLQIWRYNFSGGGRALKQIREQQVDLRPPSPASAAALRQWRSSMLLKFEHTIMVFSNLVRSPSERPKKKALHPMPQGKCWGWGWGSWHWIDTENKGKEVVDKGKDVVPPSEIDTENKGKEVVDGRVTLDLGWATFAAIHPIKIGYMVTFKLLTPDMLKVIVFNEDGIEVVTRCGKHDDAFAVNA